MTEKFDLPIRPISDLTERELIKSILKTYGSNEAHADKLAEHIARKLVDRRALIKSKRAIK